MRKRFLLVAALCAAMHMPTFADQTNLALNKTVKASSENTDDSASKAVDGDGGTRWQVVTDKEKQTDGVVTDGSYWLYVDLGDAQSFNTLRIKWENGYAKTFKVLVANELDETTQEPKWQDEAILTKTETLSDFNKYYTYFLEKAVTARYVKLQAVELGLAPYFSIWELGIYNFTDAEKTPAITTITTPKTTVAPGEEFSVNVEDQFGNAMTDADVTYTCTNAERLENGNFKAKTSGEVSITATDKQGNEKTIKLTAYVATLTTVKVSPAFVVTGEETQLTFTAFDQEGKAITDFTTSLADNKLKAEADGEQEITVKSGDVEKKVKVYALSKGSDAPTLGIDDMPVFIDSDEGIGKYNNIWEQKYDGWQIFELGDNKMLAVTNVGTFGIQKGSISETGYTTLNFDIYSTTDVDEAFVRYEGAGDAFNANSYANALDNMKFSLKGGQWNHISLNVEDATAYNGYIDFYLGKAGATTNPDILLDNVYLKKAAATTGVVVGSADANGFVSVKGEITTEEAAKLAEIDGTAFDLTKATLAEGVTKVAFKNPNAMIQVAGTVEGDDATAAADWGETKNVVVKRTDGYYFPLAQLEISDKTPVYRKFFISGAVGYKYTRSLAAKTYSTVYLNNNASIPDGCKVYEFAADAENANNVVLKEAAAINAWTPYIVYNGNDAEAELVCETTGGNIDFTAADKSTTVGNLNVIGTFNYFYGDGTKEVYGIQKQDGSNGELNLRPVGTDGIVCPFRVYFKIDNGSAKDFSFEFEGGAPTGITGIDAAAAGKAGNIYSVDGRLVKAGATSAEGLPKGMYIQNGKKFVVK